MKKVLLSAVAVMAFGVSNAQEDSSSYKPVMGTVTTEVGLAGGLNNANFDLNTGVLKFRYFLKEDMALRLGLGVNSTKEEDIDNSDPSNVETEIFKNSNTTFNIGLEKHFMGTDRLSTYAGADLLVGFNGASYEYKDNTNTTTVEGADTRGNNGSSQFGLRVLTGADYYIAKKVYLGVEAGLNFLTGSDKDQVTTTANSGTTTTTTVAGGKNGGITTNVVGGIRIGFQF